MAFKIDIHNHILPERWPDLKEVSTYFAGNFRGTFNPFPASKTVSEKEIILKSLSVAEVF